MSDAVTRSVVVEVGDGLAVTLERARLVVQRGPDEGRGVALGDTPMIIGRGESADLRLADDTVSREHLVIRLEGDAWMARDLGSKAGVKVDGVEVEGARLQHGSRLVLGETELEFRLGDETLEAPPHPDELFRGLLAKSRSMKRLFGMIEKVAPTGLPVLLLGESGTGKERLARAVHELGAVATGPYEVVDCTLLGAEGLRSELFGHVKGAFTGADADRTGALERAHGGTLFLDEVGELPAEVQAMLLRTLQEGEVRPLGSDEVKRVRVRIVSATNRNLADEVAAGRFREDLLYRLAAITLDVPPLRARGEDCILLAENFLPEGKALAEDAAAAIRRYPWPGNVRELLHAVRRAAAVAEGPAVAEADLDLLAPAERKAVAGAAAGGDVGDAPLGDVVADREVEAIRAAIARAHGNRKLAAQYLGISRGTLYRKLAKLGIE